MKTLRFQELAPERDDFECQDGTKVAFVSRVELDGLGLAKLDGILREMLRASKRVVRKPDDEKAMAALGASVDRAVKFVLPDLPDGTMQTLGLDQKLKVVNWWRSRNVPGRPPDKDGQGEAGEG
jgi:hypothetical protein